MKINILTQLLLIFSANFLFAQNVNIDMNGRRAEAIKIDKKLLLGDSLRNLIETETTEGGELKSYFDIYENLIKIKIESFGETGRWDEHYYLNEKGNVFYIVLETFKYNRPYYEEDNGIPFKVSKTERFVIYLNNNLQLNYDPKNNKNRKFEGKMSVSDEMNYWTKRFENFKTKALEHSHDDLQERWLQLQYDATLIRGMFCIKVGEYLYAFQNKQEDIDTKNKYVVEHPQFAVVKMKFNPISSEWKIIKEQILLQHCDKIEVDKNYKVLEENGNYKFRITYKVTNGENIELHQKIIDSNDLSSDVKITIIK